MSDVEYFSLKWKFYYVILSHLNCFTVCNVVSINIGYFIALIHPTQWTIANPVGADWPTKQKKSSCVSTARTSHVLCIHYVAHHTSFLSRQHDDIPSFSFAVCTVQTDFEKLKVFGVNTTNLNLNCYLLIEKVLWTMAFSVIWRGPVCPDRISNCPLGRVISY